MLGSIGWTCPKCGIIISPYQETCKTCVPIKSYSGTVSMGGLTYRGMGTITFGGFSSSGTFFAAPPKSDAQRLAEAKADADDWREKFERLIEAMNEVIEKHQDDDEDDD